VYFLFIISNIIPLWNCLISSSGLRSPSHGRILQASMFASPKKPFLLPEYVEAMACALATSGPTSLPRPRSSGDPRVLNFFDLSAFEDFAITLSSFDSDDERSPDSYQSSSESRFYSTEASIDLSSSSGCSSSLSRCFNDGSTSQGSFSRLHVAKKHQKKFSYYKRYKNSRFFLDEKAKYQPWITKKKPNFG
jgi:hypothetical protein